MKQLFLSAFVGSSVFAAGGWVGSGGELFRDAHNPWFVHNTTQVKYCLEIAPDSFSASRATVSRLVRESFAYWKTNFTAPPSGVGYFSVATQNFEEVDCAPDTDIRFLFGYETLNKEEIEFLVKPERYIGITVRTDYSPALLKGKGFVYISSDLGPHAYDNPGTLVEKGWQSERLLSYALLHETGHIFGLTHGGMGLMSEVFLDQMMSKFLAPLFEKVAVENFLEPPAQMQVCDQFAPFARKWLGIPIGLNCVRFERKSQVLWDAYALKSDGSGEELLGSFKNIRPDIFDFRSGPVNVLQITPEQKVFSPEAAAFRPFLFGPSRVDFGARATFIDKTGRPKPAYLKVSAASVTVVGGEGTNAEPVFLYSSPLSLLISISPKP